MQINIIVNPATKSWLLLVLLSVIAIYLPEAIDNRCIYIISVLIIVVIKGQQIVDVFMELNTAPRFWRLIFLSYIVLLPIIITAIYLM
ncbi:cytochrome C oxidase subunit IV family protein [Colwellia sp. 12G3]|uniref:cytochrome C oxidase subunit IV family protein n=1 Tax=Colwellia sp. 12G3 TaxID=2058299 RepID=UPI0012FF3945|nr:cytochrome C oxidase subunit IV family protein [Colwellia sp. 12G3]